MVILLIVLAIVFIIVAKVVLGKIRDKKHALKFAEIKSRAASGDSEAAKELIAMATRQELKALAAEGNSDAAKKLIEQGSLALRTYIKFVMIRDDDNQIVADAIVAALKKICGIMEENGGENYFSDATASFQNSKPSKRERDWWKKTFEYRSPKGDTIKFDDAHTTIDNMFYKDPDGRPHQGCLATMSIHLFLKMPPEIVENIAEQAELEFKQHLSNNGIPIGWER